MDGWTPKDARGYFAWRMLERLVIGSRMPRLSVLIFHRVLRERDPLRPNEPVIDEFETLISFLAANFRVRSLREAVADVAVGRGDDHCVAITFDDGYADNVDIALPILKKHAVPATFFIASGALDSGIMWNDRVLHAIRETPKDILDLGELGLGRIRMTGSEERKAAFRRLIRDLKYRELADRSELVAAIEKIAATPLPPRLMMTREQVRELGREPLADVGGHTVTHPILAKLPNGEAAREIADGKAALEALIERKVRCFAYPNGIPSEDFCAAHADMVRDAGFDLAVSTSVGGFGPGQDIYQVPRIKPWDRRPLTFGVRMLAASRRRGGRAT